MVKRNGEQRCIPKKRWCYAIACREATIGTRSLDDRGKRGTPNVGYVVVEI